MRGISIQDIATLGLVLTGAIMLAMLLGFRVIWVKIRKLRLEIAGERERAAKALEEAELAHKTSLELLRVQGHLRKRY